MSIIIGAVAVLVNVFSVVGTRASTKSVDVDQVTVGLIAPWVVAVLVIVFSTVGDSVSTKSVGVDQVTVGLIAPRGVVVLVIVFSTVGDRASTKSVGVAFPDCIFAAWELTAANVDLTARRKLLNIVLCPQSPN